MIIQYCGINDERNRIYLFRQRKLDKREKNNQSLSVSQMNKPPETLHN